MSETGKVIVATEESLRDARLQQYLNAKVTVYYAAGAYQDIGRITYMDANWLELTKDNGQRLLMPHIAIRIISLMETPKPEGDAGVLLRAAGEPGERKQISS